MKDIQNKGHSSVKDENPKKFHSDNCSGVVQTSPNSSLLSGYTVTVVPAGWRNIRIAGMSCSTVTAIVVIGVARTEETSRTLFLPGAESLHDAELSSKVVVRGNTSFDAVIWVAMAPTRRRNTREKLLLRTYLLSKIERRRRGSKTKRC